jgi:hypothetical protein
MVWIAAPGVVAPMKHVQTIGYGAMGQLPGQTVGPDYENPKLSIHRPRPNTAAGGAIEDQAGLKPLLERGSAPASRASRAFEPTGPPAETQGRLSSQLCGVARLVAVVPHRRVPGLWFTNDCILHLTSVICQPINCTLRKNVRDAEEAEADSSQSFSVN